MSDYLLHEDFDLRAQQLASGLLRQIWNDGANTIIQRQHFHDAGSLDNDTLTLDLERCVSQHHKPHDVGPNTPGSTHTCFCDTCRIKYTYTQE